MLLERARDDIDRRLIEFGYDPWQMDDFARLTPAQKFESMRKLDAFVNSARRNLRRAHGKG